MFSHYDRNNDGMLERSELELVSVDEDMKQLASGCDLADLIIFDDANKDGVLNVNEFYEAFSKLYSVSVVSLDKALEKNFVQARVGENIEIKCDVTGSPVPPIIWTRYGVDLLSLKDGSIRVFHDGSLYISDVQLTHGGVYACHAERNEDVVQTHVLNVTTVPDVKVTPAIQALAPGQDASVECWVSSQSSAKVTWLKNDEPLQLSKTLKYQSSAKVTWLKNDEPLQLSKTLKYQIDGDGRLLTVKSLAYADTGAYMCEATNNGCMHRGISSLVIQDEPQPTVKPAPSLLLVFSGEGIGLYNPESCRIIRQIQGTDMIPGTQRYVCSGDSQIPCRWGQAVNVGERYVYATQPELHRLVVLNLAQMGVTEAIETDPFPARLHYVPAWDQLWVLNWRSNADVGNKTLQVVRRASQKGPHQLVHPEPIQSHFDLAYRLFLPDQQELDVKWRYGYVGHENQRGLYKLDLKEMRFVRNVDLTPYNCVPNNVAFISRFGMVLVECKEPGSGKPSGQVILDHLSDSVIQYKPDFFGVPRVSPDSLHVVTINHQLDGSYMLGIQKAESDGLHFQFDVRTSLDVSDLGFFPSYERHSFDLFASSGEKSDLLYLNLDSGQYFLFYPPY
ncbi:unnamed protein product [Notodromas monacha]|uniref:Follistatin-related protein 5 n=1 Tax=Notodromas monacha TaxID=399045 RepID=A0A7R9BY28_9CRUS|nr:unnamed protein product [Notodromas monacha]CAG0923910.1 unnamed protein product [Notodromas monacha]